MSDEFTHPASRIMLSRILTVIAVTLVLGSVFFFYSYHYAGKIKVIQDGQEVYLPDTVAVARAISDTSSMGDFGYMMAVMRLSPSEKRAVYLDYEHLPLRSLPTKMRKRIELLQN